MVFGEWGVGVNLEHVWITLTSEILQLACKWWPLTAVSFHYRRLSSCAYNNQWQKLCSERLVMRLLMATQVGALDQFVPQPPLRSKMGLGHLCELCHVPHTPGFLFCNLYTQGYAQYKDLLKGPCSVYLLSRLISWLLLFCKDAAPPTHPATCTCYLLGHLCLHLSSALWAEAELGSLHTEVDFMSSSEVAGSKACGWVG